MPSPALLQLGAKMGLFLGLQFPTSLWKSLWPSHSLQKKDLVTVWWFSSTARARHCPGKAFCQTSILHPGRSKHGLSTRGQLQSITVPGKTFPGRVMKVSG